MPKANHIYSVNQKTELEKLAKLVLQGKPFDATDALRERIIRAKFAYDQGAELKNYNIKPHKVRREIARRLCEEFPIGLRMAYLIYEDAQMLFGFDDLLNSKELNFNLLIGSLEDDIEAARQNEDYRSVAALQKIKLDALKSRPNDLESKLAEIPFATIYYDFNPSLISSKVLKSADELEALDQKLRMKIQSGQSDQIIKQELVNILELAEYEETK